MLIPQPSMLMAVFMHPVLVDLRPLELTQRIHA